MDANDEPSTDFVPRLFELRRYIAEPGRLETLTGMRRSATAPSRRS